jgi:predicted O-methyltransferase YrrM
MSIWNYLTPKPYVQAYYESRFDALALGREEEEKFVHWGFDVGRARTDLDEALSSLDRHAYRVDKDSVHGLLFACLSQTISPERILEIGTFDGSFTAVLAKLFPKASITSVDLPESDPLLRARYHRNRSNELELYRKIRSSNVSADNVTVIERNSLFLLEEVSGPFDLVWVDAGHLYPEVAWDTANAWHLCSPGGFVLSDDVIIRPPTRRRFWEPVSSDAYETLSYLEARVHGGATLFLKRRGKRHAADPYRRRHVALMRKRSDD